MMGRLRQGPLLPLKSNDSGLLASWRQRSHKANRFSKLRRGMYQLTRLGRHSAARGFGNPFPTRRMDVHLLIEKALSCPLHCSDSTFRQEEKESSSPLFDGFRPTQVSVTPEPLKVCGAIRLMIA